MRLFRSFLLACVSLAGASATSADIASCQRVLSFVLGRMVYPGNTVAERGTLTAEGTRCHLEGMAVRDNVINYEIALISWENKDLSGFVESGALPENIDFAIEDFRVVPKTGDPWMDYMFEIQNRYNTTDVEVMARWDGEQREFLVDRLFIDFPGENSIGFSGSVLGLDPLVQTTLREGISGLRIGDLQLRVENEGYLASFLLPPLVGALSGIDTDPEEFVEGIKTRAFALIAELPDPVFSPASRDSLRALVLGAPAPRGQLEVTLNANGGLAVAPFFEMGLTLSAPDFSDYWAHFEGTRIDVMYQPSDPAE